MVNLNRFYTYAYLREDKTPYYIGKGQGNRVCRKGKMEIKPPKDKSRIIFLKQNLTEEEAFRHEIYMIAVIGRKDLGTGILRNRTDGGEGASGLLVSDDIKKKMSKVHKGKKLSPEHKKILNECRVKTHSSESKEKISKSKIGNNWNVGKILSEEHKEKIRQGNLNKVVSEDTKKKISISRSNNPTSTYKLWRITFDDGNVIEQLGLTKWAKENGYDTSSIHRICTGRCKRHKDIVAVEKLEQKT